MKKILLLAFTLALAVGAFAQVPSVPVKKRSSLPATCSPNVTLQLLVYKTGANSGLYYCSATDTWTAVRSDVASSSTGLDVTQGTITVNTQPGVDHTATWNSGGVTFTGLKSNVTDTASAAGSKLMDLQVGGNTKFSVSKTGAITMAGSTSGTTVLTPTAAAGTTTATLPARTITVMGTDEVLRSYLASTVTYNNTAALADTALSVNVAASGIYQVELVVHSTNVSSGLNLDFAGTATVTNFIGQWTAWEADYTEAGPGKLRGSRVSAAGTDFGPTGMDGLGSGAYYTFQGSVEINAAGTFLLRGAQNAATADNTTILRGSTLKLTKLN